MTPTRRSCVSGHKIFSPLTRQKDTDLGLKMTVRAACTEKWTFGHRSALRQQVLTTTVPLALWIQFDNVIFFTAPPSKQQRRRVPHQAYCLAILLSLSTQCSRRVLRCRVTFQSIQGMSASPAWCWRSRVVTLASMTLRSSTPSWFLHFCSSSFAAISLMLRFFLFSSKLPISRFIKMPLSTMEASWNKQGESQSLEKLWWVDLSRGRNWCGRSAGGGGGVV